MPAAPKPAWKTYLQWQKPMADVLTALIPVTLWAVYAFGWRVLLTVLLAMGVCWATEYFLFTSKQNKPASMASLVTGALLALVMPPNIDVVWLILGCLVAIIFGKMSFGGFGKNIFNPAMVGRCFLYICFPAALSATWFAPLSTEGLPGGFARYTTTTRTTDTAYQEFEDIQAAGVDAVSGATTLAATKIMNEAATTAAAVMNGKVEEGDKPQARGYDPEAVREATREAVASARYWDMFIGRISGSQGETGGLVIVLAMIYLLYRRSANYILMLSPMIGVVLMTTVFCAVGLLDFPVLDMLMLNFFAGGALFAFAFMTTEPVSAPLDNRARWIYGILIGCLAVLIRTESAFNAGLMFSILLGNAVGPLIEVGFASWDEKKKAQAQKAGA